MKPPHSHLRILLAALLCWAALPTWCADAAEMDLTPQAIARLAPGPFSTSQLPNGYSHVVMIAWPRLVADNPQDIPSMAAKFATKFGTVILADVRSPNSQQGQYALSRLGIGHLIREEGQVRIVNSQSPELSFVARQVLSSGEQELNKVRQIARYRTGLLFETPAILKRNGQHQELTLRQFVWTSARQGGLASLLWVVDTNAPGGPRVADQHLIQLPASFADDRQLAVDTSQFNMLGMPGRTAFALAQLPQGTRIPFHPRLAQLAALPKYDASSLPQLAAALARTVAAHTTQTAGQ